jgi:hypothetical protein
MMGSKASSLAAIAAAQFGTAAMLAIASRSAEFQFGAKQALMGTRNTPNWSSALHRLGVGNSQRNVCQGNGEIIPRSALRVYSPDNHSPDSSFSFERERRRRASSFRPLDEIIPTRAEHSVNRLVGATPT